VLIPELGCNGWDDQTVGARSDADVIQLFCASARFSPSGLAVLTGAQK
jgi:hypothetical protein